MHGLMMDSPLLITAIMRFADRNYADREIVSVTFDNPRHRTNWGQVFRRARMLANALKAAGVKEGDRVATLAWNDYRHLELYYAVSCMGAVLHTVNPRLFPEQLEFIINHAEDKLLFVDPTLLPALAPLAGKLPTVAKTIVMTSAEAMPAAVAGKLPDYESFIAAARGHVRRGPNSTNVPRARSATPRARPAIRKAFSTVTALPCCTPTAVRRPTR